MPKTSMPPFREFAWVQDKWSKFPTCITRKIDIYKNP